MAAVAELGELEFRQLSERSSRSSDRYLVKTNSHFWPRAAFGDAHPKADTQETAKAQRPLSGGILELKLPATSSRSVKWRTAAVGPIRVNSDRYLETNSEVVCHADQVVKKRDCCST